MIIDFDQISVGMFGSFVYSTKPLARQHDSFMFFRVLKKLDNKKRKEIWLDFGAPNAYTIREVVRSYGDKRLLDAEDSAPQKKRRRSETPLNFCVLTQRKEGLWKPLYVQRLLNTLDIEFYSDLSFLTAKHLGFLSIDTNKIHAELFNEHQRKCLESKRSKSDASVNYFLPNMFGLPNNYFVFNDSDYHF